MSCGSLTNECVQKVTVDPHHHTRTDPYGVWGKLTSEHGWTEALILMLLAIVVAIAVK